MANLKFSEGEKVLCFHGPLIYEAKCLKTTTTKEKQNKYFIHYAGWNKNRDEWVPETRVLKYNDANLAIQKQVENAHLSHPNKRKAGAIKSETDSRSSTPSVASESTPMRSCRLKHQNSSSSTSGQESGSEVPKTKRGRYDCFAVESKDHFLNKVDIEIKIPDELKSWLVDDWDMITKQKKLHTIPAKVTVEQILDNYIAFKKSVKSNNTNKESTILDTVNGIKEYFNSMLRTQLLYKFERQQFEKIKMENKTPAEVYGATHLLRLFTRIGTMLAYTSLNERNVQVLQQNLQEFLKFASKNSGQYFSLQEYVKASPEYSQKCL